MKCKNCGANYRSRELFCPYCKTPNPRGKLWKQQRQAAQQDYQWAAGEVVPVLRWRAANRILNRVLLIELGLLVLCVIGVIAAFALGNTALQAGILQGNGEINEELAALYEEERFGELYARLSETELFGEDYYEYSQMALLYSDYESFCESRLRFFYEIEQQEAPDEYTVSRLVGDIHDVIAADIPAYPELTERNAAFAAQYRNEVLMFAQVLLGLNESEMETLGQEYLTMAEEEALTEAIWERRAWE